MINYILIYYYMFTMQFLYFFWHKQKHHCNLYDYGLGINPV